MESNKPALNLKEYKEICLNVTLWGLILYFGAFGYQKILGEKTLTGIAFVDFMLGCCLIMAGLTSYLKYHYYSNNPLLLSLRFFYMPIAFIGIGILLIEFFRVYT
jgi:hypothetical protein